MDAANDGRQIAVDSGDEGQTGRAAKPCRCGAEDRDAFQKGDRHDDHHQTGARSHEVDALQDSGEDADLILGHGDEHCEGSAEIDGSGGEATPEDGEGQVLTRLLDLVAHDRRQVEADQAVTDSAKRADQPPVGKALVELREVKCAAVMRGSDVGEENDQSAAGDGARAAEVVDPLAEREAADVEQHEEDDDADGDASGEEVAVFEPLDARAADVEADSDAGEDDGGEIEDVREPVTPAGEEAVLFAEAALGPEVDAALAGPFLREFGDRRALRPEKATEGDDPEPDGDGAR